MANKRPDAAPEQSIMMGFMINAVIWTPFAFFDTGITTDIMPWVFVILMGTIQVGLAYVFFSIGIKRTTPLLACLTTALEPILNPIWVALAVAEIPGPYAIMGGVIIIIAIICYNVWELKRFTHEA
jgi:drug/metabolite transporter (DMT)-like permease